MATLQISCDHGDDRSTIFQLHAGWFFKRRMPVSKKNVVYWQTMENPP
jgi:hypothetical protein